VFLLNCRQGLRLALAQRGFPGVPGSAVVNVFERHEDGEIVQPEGLLRLESLVLLLKFFGVNVLEILVSLIQYAQFPADHRPIIHVVGGEGGPVSQVGWLEQFFVYQLIQADQVGVAGKGREALVRRIAVAGGAQGQHLPQGAARL